MPRAFKSQDYDSLKKPLIKTNELFTDTEFPPNNKSLFFSRVEQNIEWKRPKDICKKPLLIVDGVSTDDLVEGEHGNGWFVAACACLVQNQKAWAKVVPNAQKQDWSAENQYAGIFRFSFWRFGEWVDVVIDDLLPTRNNQLIFTHSKTRNEFWSALLEKAYAKLLGDYESLRQGNVGEALVDFTGGVGQTILVRELQLEVKPDQQAVMFDEVLDNFTNASLICCSLEPNKTEDQNLDCGLVAGRGYPVTDVKKLPLNSKLKEMYRKDALLLLRLKNPWGGEKMWNGPWSEGSEQMSQLSAPDRKNFGLDYNEEAEFWIPFDELCTYFTRIEMCHSVNTSILTTKKTWSESSKIGEWIDGAKGTMRDLAGGGPKQTTFLSNPQYVFDIQKDDTVVIISLEQEDTRKKREIGSNHLPIGFQVVKVEANRKYRIHKMATPSCECGPLVSRSIFKKHALAAGRYVFISFLETPRQTGKFLFRLFIAGTASLNLRCDIGVLDHECPPKGTCMSRGPSLATTITIHRAEGLKTLNEKQTMDAYIAVTSEGETVKSTPVLNSLAPTWNLRATFYRKNPSMPIVVEVCNSNRLKDDFLGQVTLDADKTDGADKVEENQLFGRKKESAVEKPGKLFISYVSTAELDTI